MSPIRLASRVLLAGLALLGATGAGLAAEPKPGQPVAGRIVGFECGDNCYLTIRTKRGEEVVGLCSAPECEKWNENATMPARFKGRSVTAQTGTGTQVDGNGTVMGETLAFRSLKIGK